MPRAWGRVTGILANICRRKARSVHLKDWWGWGGVNRPTKTQTGGEIQMECRLKRHRGHRRRKVLRQAHGLQSQLRSHLGQQSEECVYPSIYV